MRGATACTCFLLLCFLLAPAAVGAAKKDDSRAKPKETKDGEREGATQATTSGGPDAEECSRKCSEKHCDHLKIRYGKYCGVTHTGCVGEEPCDDVDRCCMAHDHCVRSAGVFENQCHSVFISCISGHLKDGKSGFSKICPYEKVVPVMKQGIEMTMAVTGNIKIDF